MGSVTDFARRYHEDLFFRTTTLVVALQTGFALFLLALVAIGGSYLYQSIIGEVSEALAKSLAEDAPPGSAFALVENLEYARTSIIVIVGTLVLVGTAIFGYLIAQLALGPTRSALESQKQFVSNVAHELRTPLSIIKTNAEVALFSEAQGTKTRAMLESTVEELDRISDIINNLLSLSAVVRPGRLKLRAVSLPDVVAHSVANLKDFAAKRSIELKVMADDVPPVWGNAAALEQIVMNLVKNAVSYSREGAPPVLIRIASDHHGHVELSVEDEGVGIPENDLARVVEPFYRGDPSRTRRMSGSGLGLTIVNELLKLHEGKMRIRSTPGRGTKVLVTLRRAPDAKEETSQASPSEVIVDFSPAA